MKNAISLFSGLLFSFGLSVSGMINPEKVIGFLNVFGSWDYSLAFVMGGAVGINLVLFYLILKKRPIYSQVFHLPKNKSIDANLVLGSFIFGIGWGIGGICPGPAIVNLVRLDIEGLFFILAMLTGMYSHKLFEKSRKVKRP